MTSRMKANALTTAPAAALPTPNSRANSGSAGATRPKPERDHEGDADEGAHLGREPAQRPHADLLGSSRFGTSLCAVTYRGRPLIGPWPRSGATRGE